MTRGVLLIITRSIQKEEDRAISSSIDNSIKILEEEKASQVSNLNTRNQGLREVGLVGEGFLKYPQKKQQIGQQ